MKMELSYLYLLSPLHTGGASQEGNLVGIARESHTELPYGPSSTVRGRLRAAADDMDDNFWSRFLMFGPDLKDINIPSGDPHEAKRKALQKAYEENNGRTLTQLEPGNIWIGDASILWMPVSSLSHGVIWVSCPMLLRRWARVSGVTETIPTSYETNLDKRQPIYLKDAILQPHGTDGSCWNSTRKWQDWKKFGLDAGQTGSIERVLILPDAQCKTLIQMSLWRQVKIKLDEHKTVDGGFRYEEAIPPDTLMYFPWGLTTQASSHRTEANNKFTELLGTLSILQLGGQESLGRGFVEQWIGGHEKAVA